MSLADEILAILPTAENAAISAAELFEQCKGAEDVKAVSMALSNLFAARAISRKEGVFGRAKFADWNQRPHPQINIVSSEPSSPASNQTQELNAPHVQMPAPSEAHENPIDIPRNPLPQINELMLSDMAGIDIAKIYIDDLTNEQLQREQATAKAANTFTADDDKLLDELLKQNPLDVQIGGDHYKKLGAYQPWQVLQAWLTPEEFRGYMKGTAIAYLARERDKGGDMDIEKGKHTLEGLLNLQVKVAA